MEGSWVRLYRQLEFAEATRKKPSNRNSSTFPLSLRPSSKSSGEHADVVPDFLALNITSPSCRNAALFRLSGAYPRSLQAQIQASVVLSNASRPFWLTSDPQRRVSSNSRHTSSTSGLVTSSISRPTEPSRRVCHTNTTMGTSLSRHLIMPHTIYTSLQSNRHCLQRHPSCCRRHYQQDCR